MSKDLYSVLNVSKTSSLDEIKRAFKKLAIKYHPDKCQNEKDKEINEAKFKEINQAYSVLSDTDKRRNYDQFGVVDDVPQNHMNGMSMDDILKDIFGGGGFNGFSHPVGNASFSFTFMDGMGNVQHSGGIPQEFQNMFGGMQRQMKKQDVIEVQIDINDIYYGHTKKVEFEMLEQCDSCSGTGAQDPSHILKCLTCNGNGVTHQQVGPFFMQTVSCPTCAGQGTTVQHNKHCQKCKGRKTLYNKKLFELKLPKGIPNFYEVVMEGKGAYNQEAKANNDIKFRFVYNIKPPYRLDDNKTVHYDLDISLEELLGGFSKDVEVYKEKMTLKSEHYFNPTNTLVLQNLGVYDMKGEKQRDLHIHFNVIYTDNERYKRYADVIKRVLKVSKEETGHNDNVSNKQCNLIKINEYLI